MHEINVLISLLTALQGYAKDIHYNVRSYGKHLFADLIGDDVDEFIDDLKENALMGQGIMPLASKMYFAAAAAAVPSIIGNDHTNLVLAYEYVKGIRSYVQNIQGATKGINSLLDKISEHLDKMCGLLFMQTRTTIVVEGAYTKEECTGCAERAIEKAKEVIAKIDTKKTEEAQKASVESTIPYVG